MKTRAAAVAVVLLMSIGCGPRGPVVGASDRPPGVGGTIAGIVKTVDGTTALSARKVTATNTETGVKFEASTASNGGYTIQVPKGNYKLDVELRPGETLAS